MENASDRRPYIIAGALLAASLIFCSACALYRKLHPNLDQEIAGPVSVSSEWMEILPEEPLKPEREVQQVLIWFAQPYATNADGIISPDGHTFHPEVQLIDQRGDAYNLRISGISSSGIALSCCKEGYRPLPKDRKYRAVRIRSDRPVSGSKVVWRCYNPWDRK
ncbi:MAG TPA: hypothetical protein VN282_06745 [Pyrinomonadaceae bacterium]|nr:hypothetical protein [Pyrinomonadaceae bacterium]